MIISVKHVCGHVFHHVVFGKKEILVRQEKSLATTQCPDCFHAKVMRLTAAHQEPLQRRR